MFWKFCYLGGNCPGVFVLGGNCPGGNCPGVIVRGVIVRGVIVLEPSTPNDNILLFRAVEKRLKLVILRGAQNDNNLKIRAMREAYINSFCADRETASFVSLRRV